MSPERAQESRSHASVRLQSKGNRDPRSRVPPPRHLFFREGTAIPRPGSQGTDFLRRTLPQCSPALSRHCSSAPLGPFVRNVVGRTPGRSQGSRLPSRLCGPPSRLGMPPPRPSHLPLALLCSSRAGGVQDPLSGPRDGNGARRIALSHWVTHHRLFRTSSASRLLSLKSDSGKSSDDFPKAGFWPFFDFLDIGPDESRMMSFPLSMMRLHFNQRPVRGRERTEGDFLLPQFSTKRLGLWLLLGVFGAVLVMASSRETRERPVALPALSSPSSSTFPDGPSLIPPDSQSRHPEGALPCHHLRTAGCSLECPHESCPPGSPPGLFPDLFLSTPLTDPSPPPPLRGAFRDLPSRPSSDRGLPDPPPRASSLETVSNVP